MKTEHVRKGQIFRANSDCRGKVWRDWVCVNWGPHGKLPNKICGFVDLGKLPQDCGLECGGIHLKPGIHAVVENAEVSTDEEELDKSELFVPITKEVGEPAPGNASSLRLFLADVEAFDGPVAVIPDSGGGSKWALCAAPACNLDRLVCQVS